MEEYKTTEEEIAKIIYDTDLYEKVKKISAVGNYDFSFLFFRIVVEINTNYLSRLKQSSLDGKRREFLIDRIENELRYHEMHAKKID
jgi:hypothetical protein